MNRSPRLTAFVFCLLCLLGQGSASQQASTGLAKPPALPFVDSKVLGGEERYLTHLSTDKPLYRPGETLYLRGVVLHHATHRPMPASGQQPLRAMAEVVGPKGNSVASGWVAAEDSILGCRWQIPADLPGGRYNARITYPLTGQPPAERPFDIRVYRAPRMKTQIKFLRDGYGPGDVVAATLDVKRSEGGIPIGAKVRITARLDGAEVFKGAGTVDAAGLCTARFSLPKEVKRGQGSLAMAVEDGGVVETATKTIPILLRTVDLTLYPEGGDLIEGVENRVYFEAFTPAHKPADLVGLVIDQDGREVAEFKSDHEGRGRFRFTPRPDQTYELKITQPSGISKRFPLPAAKTTGVALATTADIYAAADPIELELASAAPVEQLTVTLSKREKELARERPTPAGQANRGRVVFKLANDANDAADGVLIATVWDAEGRPLAERLVFRQPGEAVRISIASDRERYVPGQRAKLTLTTTNPRGQPVSAIVSLTVTDDSVLEMLDRREQPPRLPVMVLLENDVRELADAEVYLDSSKPNAARAVDLLLGTQGWRRFAMVDPAKVFAQHHEQALRALSWRMASSPQHLSGRVKSESNELLDRWRLLNRDQSARFFDESRVADFELAFRLRDQRGKALELSQRGAAGGFAAREARRFRQNADLALGGRGPVVRSDFQLVRVYAHQVRPNRQIGKRIDFTETLFWHAGIRTNDLGQANVEFGLNDSVTGFRVLADAFSAAGALGQSSALIESVEPFYVEPKLPLEVTSGDQIQASIAAVNSTETPLEAAIKAVCPQLKNVRTSDKPLSLDPLGRRGQWLTMDVNDFQGEAQVTVSASAGPYADEVTRRLRVQPLGFPQELGAAGLLAADSSAAHTFLIPQDLAPGSLTAEATVYPSPLANMTEALKRLVREPSGCFEQTSSTVYPLVMAQQYFMSHSGVDPQLITHSDNTLEKGYQRLLGYECKGGGFEWWGHDPGHDSLTAYGLMEFSDMAQVRFVDESLLERTRRWLLGQRDGNGGYARQARTLHNWLPQPEISATYNTWALLASGVGQGLEKEIRAARAAGENSENTYVVALAANVLQLAGDSEGGNHLLDKLAGKQTEAGWLDGSTTSVVGSGGEALKIETTSLAAMAWLADDKYAAQVERAMKWISESCQAGRFGSTQSTILALKAIVAYDQSRAAPKAAGTLSLLVDGKEIGQPVSFTPDQQGAIHLPDFAAELSPGQHRLQVKMAAGSRMPYSVSIGLHRRTPDSAPDCKLQLEVDLRDDVVREGAITEARVALVNRNESPVPSPIAIIGAPGGLEPDHDQLKELVTQNLIAAYEVRGREIVLYWRKLEPEQRVELPLRLVAAVPGVYTGPASRAYLYYTDEHKHWVPGLQVRIQPRSK